MRIDEYAVVSKTGHADDCEDAICISEDFVAVIDGVSSKTERRWGGLTGGQIASRTIRAAVSDLAPASTLREAADVLTSALRSLYSMHNCLDVMDRDPG